MKHFNWPAALAFFMRGCLIAMCLALAVSLITSCSAPKNPHDDLTALETTAQFSGGDVQLLGRYAKTEQGYKMGWPGSGISVRLNGRWLDVDIMDDGQGIMDMTVNGQETTPVFLKKGSHRYRVFNGPKAKQNLVTLTRRTEVFDTGYFTIKDVVTDGEFLKIERAPRKILFVGDSITAGFGVRGDTKDCTYEPVTNAPLQAYGALTAKTFGAEAHFIAISGRGVIHNWDANPAPVMPAQIDFALPDNQDEPTWDHGKFAADVIVTTLGTNDWSVINPGQAKFRTGYRDMLRELRERFPAAHIVTVNGPLLSEEKGGFNRDGIDWAMNDLLDSNISTLTLSLSNTGVRWSCNSHPGRDSMRKMARELSVHLAAKTGWEFAEALPMIAPPDLPVDGQSHFKKRVLEIDQESVKNSGVMLVGDSLTEGWLWQDGVFPAKTPVSNHGVGWDMTSGVLARMPQIQRHNPDDVFIMIGTNDLSWGVPKTAIKENVDAIIKELQSAFPDAKIHLQSILPRESDKRADIVWVNEQYQQMAKVRDIHWIDLSDVFAAKDGTLKPSLTYDGLHLNEAGYQAWADAIGQYTQ